MGIFSEELRILDRNTVRYMMDEMQSEIDQQKRALKQKDEQLVQKESELQNALARIKELEENR